MAKYDKEARDFNLKKFYAKHRMFKVYLDKKEDAAIIEHLDSHKNKSKAIRQLLNGAKIPVANITFDDDKLKELTDDIVRQIQNGELVMVTESETQGEWIPITYRPMTDEEEKEFCVKLDIKEGSLEDWEKKVFTCHLPDDGQEILTSFFGRYVQEDICSWDEYGCGLENNGDWDGIDAWMPKPEPYKKGGDQ